MTDPSGEIAAFSRAHREQIRPYEVEMIRALDQAYLEEATKPAMERGGTQPYTGNVPSVVRATCERVNAADVARTV